MPAAVEQLLYDGTFVDVALAALVVEFIALVVLARRRGSALRLPDIIGQLLAGGILLLALRCALTGAGAVWIVLLLTLALPAHLFDLIRRAR